MSSDTYLTIKAPVEGLYKDKGSRFIAFAYPIYSEAEVKPLVDGLKSKYYDARHHCFAWRMGRPGTPGERFRLNDDGEPAGSAARPIYGQILSRELTNLLVVVVRYFGGIKLGVPGLIAAYKESTGDALELAEVVEKTEDRIIQVEFGYTAMNGVMKVIKDLGISILGQQSDNLCRMTLRVRLRDYHQMQQRLSDIEGLTELSLDI